jgi:(p)ppGpp synthase/HD superfamily hydrolase
MTRSLSYDAMVFAREVHANQVRKYTGNPYVDHLAEVAGVVSTVLNGFLNPSNEEILATAWLHDCIEDQNVPPKYLETEFGRDVCNGVLALSDLEPGNRKERKSASCERLSHAAPWIQTIKVADLISNTSSIVKHDPKFSAIYLEEKSQLLDVLKLADPRLLDIARAQVKYAK